MKRRLTQIPNGVVEYTFLGEGPVVLVCHY
jgi:hypothetical protein